MLTAQVAAAEVVFPVGPRLDEIVELFTTIFGASEDIGLRLTNPGNERVIALGPFRLRCRVEPEMLELSHTDLPVLKLWVHEAAIIEMAARRVCRQFGVELEVYGAVGGIVLVFHGLFPAAVLLMPVNRPE